MNPDENWIMLEGIWGFQGAGLPQWQSKVLQQFAQVQRYTELGPMNRVKSFLCVRYRFSGKALAHTPHKEPTKQ